MSSMPVAHVATPSGTRPTEAARPSRAALEATLQPTGFGSSETTLAIARDGTIFFAPAHTAEGNAVLRSRDGGATWTPLVPRRPDGARHGRTQPFMYLDPVTERLFFHTGVMGFHPWRFDLRRHRGFHLSWSDDHGDTWNGSIVAQDSLDWGKLYGGPPVSSAPAGYPNVLYFSAPSPFSTPIPPLDTARRQIVRRSLDGGASWEKVGSLSLHAADVPGCDRREWVIFGNGVVGRDGAVHLGLRRGPRVAVATSRSEGRSWCVCDVPGSDLVAYRHWLQVLFVDPNYVLGEPLAIDADGNLYAHWPAADGRLRLSVSRDGGDTWTRPVVVSAPGVTHVSCSAATTRAPGTLAMAYYGSEDGVRFHGYVAESHNALDAEPVFASVVANDLDDPLFPKGFDGGYPGIWLGSDLVEIVQVKYHPSGDIWAAFSKDMRRGAWDVRAHGGSKLQGVAARVRHA
jgi:hypothetical protein